jgi:anti-sigma factor RsiW
MAGRRSLCYARRQETEEAGAARGTSMTCRELIEFLMAYLDNELPQEQRTVFEAHLVQCTECVAYLQEYEETVRLGKAAFADADGDAGDQVPEQLIAAILAARDRNF